MILTENLKYSNKKYLKKSNTTSTGGFCYIILI